MSRSIQEGSVKKGGQNSPPITPKPNIKPKSRIVKKKLTKNEKEELCLILHDFKTDLIKGNNYSFYKIIEKITEVYYPIKGE